MQIVRFLALFLWLGALASACGGGPAASISDPPAPVDPPDPAGQDPVLVGAGDIAACYSNGDELTASLLDTIAGTVFTAGDNAYQNGTRAEFEVCYDPSWGRHLSRTRPSPGNHDYFTAGATAYFDYFGSQAGPPGRGYYSYDLGAWHVISLDSNIPSGAASAQAQWLEADLEAHPTTCTLVYWHHPLFSSGQHGSMAKMKEIWEILDAKGVDVVVSGHDHDYERFAPQDAEGRSDPQGIREFVIGTGGESLRPFRQVLPNSEVRDSATFGVLKLTLRPAGYEWEFVPGGGAGFRDSGSAACVTI